LKSFALLVVSGDAYVEEITVGSKREIETGTRVDIFTAFKPHPKARGEIPYIPASSWVGVLRHLLENYYDLPAQTPRIRRGKEGTLVAPIHECQSPSEILTCPVCKLLSRRDVVAWFDDLDPRGEKYSVQRGRRAGEYIIKNERNEIVAQVVLKDEVVLPRDVEKTIISADIAKKLGVEIDKDITGKELIEKGIRFEPIPREVQVVSGAFKLGAKFDMAKLSFNDLKPFFIGLSLLEDRYIGRRGSRGYGRVKFDNIVMTLRSKEYYEGGDEIPIEVDERKPRDVLKQWGKIRQAVDEKLKQILG